MRNENAHKSALAITEKILDDAELEAQRILENAATIAEAEIARANKEAQQIQREILAQAEEKALKLKSRRLATSKIEAKKILLRAREEAVLIVFKQIEEQLNGIRQNPDRYRHALKNLATEAITGVGEPEVVLQVNGADGPIVDQAFWDDVKNAVSRSSGEEVGIAIQFNELVMGAGCVAKSTNGRVVFDNTFHRRFERMKPNLRPLIVRHLSKRDA